MKLRGSTICFLLLFAVPGICFAAIGDGSDAAGLITPILCVLAFIILWPCLCVLVFFLLRRLPMGKRATLSLLLLVAPVLCICVFLVLGMRGAPSSGTATKPTLLEGAVFPAGSHIEYR